jgi:membrane fusion protein (multidrug efflux system)
VERYQTLLDAKGVSKQDLDEANAALLEARSDVEAAKAALETARINLDYTRVTAPISGLIGNSSVTEGALVTANQETALATIRQMNPIYVDLSESSTNMLKIHSMIARGSMQRAENRPKVVLQLEDGSDYAHEGVISSRESSVSESTDTVTVRATMPNPDYFLLAGLYVRAKVSLGSAQNVFLVPQRAVSRNVKGQATAMFVGEDNKVETRLLNANEAYGDYWVVKDDIAAGDRLIVDGLQKVANGQEVTTVTVQLDDDGVAEVAFDESSSSPAAKP